MNINFTTGNDAFQHGQVIEETERILQKIVEQMRQGLANGIVTDINGNKIGWWHL